MTDEGIASLASNGRLEDVSVAGIPSVGPKTLKTLSLKCSSTLMHLNISWCRSVTENMLGVLVDSCIRLTTVTAWGCSSVTARLANGHRSTSLQAIHGPA